jgi:hypothetical protein
MVRNHPTTRTYALRGRIFCADCGRAYVGQWNARDKRIEYRHRTRDGGCRHHSVGGQIEKQVLERISEFQLKPERARQQYEQAIKQHREQFGHIDDMLASAKAERAKQIRSLDKLTATYLDPDMQMSKSQYFGLKDGIANKVDALDRQIIDLNKEREKSPLPLELEDFEAFYLRFKVELSDEQLTPEEEAQIVEEIPVTGFPPASPEQKHQFLSAILERRRTSKRLAELYERLNVRVEVRPGREPMVTIFGQATTSS